MKKTEFNGRPLTPYDSWRVLGLSDRAYGVLDLIATYNPPLITIRDVSGLKDYYLLKHKNCGQKTVAEIRCVLQEMGLELGIEHFDKDMYWGA